MRIVIPTASFGPHLDGLLGDLTRNLASVPQFEAEVFVTDASAVYDVTPLLLTGQALVEHPWLSLTNGPAVNRNRGAQGCEREWLIFLDDDVRLEDEWALHWSSILLNPDTADLVGGVIGSQQPKNWFSQAAEDFVVRHREYPEGWYLAAAHLGIRVSAFSRLQGFSELFGYGAEDWDICRRAHGLGLRVGITDAAVVFHRNATNWKALKLKATQYGSANATFDADAADFGSASEFEQAEGAAQDPEIFATSTAPRAKVTIPVRAARWVRAEYRLLRHAGRSRRRAMRSTALYIPWMATYLRARRHSA